MKLFTWQLFPFVLLMLTSLTFTYPEYRQYPIHITWSPNGLMIAASGYQFAWVIDVKTGEVLLDIPVGEVEVEAQDWSADSERLALSFDGSIYIWNVVSKTQVFDFRTRSEYLGYIADIDWSQDGTIIASSYETISAGSGVHLWETENYQKISTISDILLSDLEIHPNNTQLAFTYLGDPPNLVMFFNTAEQKLQFGNTRSIAFEWTTNGAMLIIGDVTGRVSFWDNNAIEISTSFFTGSPETIMTLSVTPDISQIVITKSNFSVQMTSFTADFSPYGGRIAFSELVLPSLLETTIITPQKNARLLGGGLIQVVVPDPTIERLNAIAEGCLAPEIGVASVSDEARLPEFVTTIEALSDEQIPPGCKADLLAVAEAIQAVE